MSVESKHSLRTRIALILTIVVGGYALLDHAVQRFMVMPRFAELEEQSARADLERVRRALYGEAERVDRRCHEWAEWRETRALFSDSLDERARFVDSNLTAAALAHAELDLCYVIDREGRIRAGAAFDRVNGTPLHLASLSLDRLSPSHPWLVREPMPDGTDGTGGGAAKLPAPVRGLSVTEVGPVFLASRAIPGEPEGPAWIGTIVVGRRLDRALIDTIAERTSIDVQVWILTDPNLPPDVARAAERATSSTTAPIEALDERTLRAWTTLDDSRHIPTLLVGARLARDVSEFGAEALLYSLVSTVAAGTLLVLVLLTVLRRIVLAPLAHLTDHAVAIGRTDDVGAKLELDREDEIGVLSREFDRMMEKLEHSRAEVVRTARVAGMSEISTGVLHNVGNALNSVNASANVISERVRSSGVVKLERVTSMIEGQGERLGEFITSNPKGKHVAPYISEVTRLMRSEHDEIAHETEKLLAGMEHLRAIVASQQELAGKNELREAVRVEDQVKFAATLAELPAAGDGGSMLEIDGALPNRVLLDRHKLVQILVNLLKNARESIAETGRPGQIRVSIAHVDTRLRVVVEDDGGGITPENLARVFQHGFTTKARGHGFGLHASANAAVEMGGRLDASSDGPGRGARFVLDLPCELAPHV